MATFDPLQGYPELGDAERVRRAEAFEATMRTRRTVRQFAATPVPRAVIESAIRTAGRAPCGANQQPWTFVAVSDPATQRRIREAAEAEEREFYQHRATEAWLQDLAPLGTDARKPFLERAPWLIAVFQQRWHEDADGTPHKHYYVTESVGIATGVLITALHHAGLACLTHTPSPMGFLNQLLERPASERPFVLLVVGHAAAGARVPDLQRKDLSELATFL